jgi:hypothetical protein
MSTDTTAAATDLDTTGPHPWRAAWRQHRAWVIGAVALVALAGLAFGVIVLMIPACASTPWDETTGATCSTNPVRILWGFARVGLYALPLVAGAVLGTVTFGPDVEQRTQVFALTQGIGRLRWWTTKVVVVCGPVLAALVLLGFGVGWGAARADHTIITSIRLTAPIFDITGLVPASRFLVAYAAAVAVALIWRSVAGVVAGLVIGGLAFAGTVPLQPLVAPHVSELIPIQQWLDDTSGRFAGGPPDSAYPTGGYADIDGNSVDTGISCSTAASGESVCVATPGTAYYVQSYVPDSGYLQMMLLISGINVLVGGAFLGAAAAGLRRRDL